MAENTGDQKKHSKFCILAAATRLFAQMGLDKCSTREIAKESDANISLISYHFGGKEGLYKEVMREHALKIKERVQDVVSDIDNLPITRELFLKDMTMLVDHMIHSHLENPELLKIFEREKIEGMPHALEVHTEIFYPLITKFFKLFKAGQENGFVKKDINPALFFITLSEGIFGFYKMMGCPTQLEKDCASLTADPKLLRDQILKIYLTGVLDEAK